MKRFACFSAVVLYVITIYSFPCTAADKIKIGLSLSDIEIERWPVEEAIMRRLANEQGAELISQIANHDNRLQNAQIANMVDQGADVVIIIAEDGSTAAEAVAKAAEKGIPCISYDRLIKSDKLAAYISFDNIEVGRIQARAIVDRVDRGNFVLIGGSPTDNNAVLLRKGQMEIIQPLVDQDKIRIVADHWVNNWAQAKAAAIMQDILNSQNNRIDAVIASNDSTALGALQAMKTAGLAGKVPLSGQDATAAGCKAIVEGELTMTVFKDVRLLSPIAIDLAIKLARKEKLEGLRQIPLAELTVDSTMQGSIPCRFLKVVKIDKDNLYDEIILNGFQQYDDLYRDIPANRRPPRP